MGKSTRTQLIGCFFFFSWNLLSAKKNVSLDKWKRTVHSSCCLHTEASPYDISGEIAVNWHGSICSSSKHTPTQPSAKQRCMCPLSLLVPSHYCKQFLQCLWIIPRQCCSIPNKAESTHTKHAHKWKAGNLEINTATEKLGHFLSVALWILKIPFVYNGATVACPNCRRKSILSGLFFAVAHLFEQLCISR